MNIQTNLQSMNTLAGKKASRHQTDSFMEKLRRRFGDEPDGFSGGVSPGAYSSVSIPADNFSQKKYAYSTRNRSIQHPALNASSINEALQMGISQRRQSQDRVNAIKDHNALKSANPSPRAQDHLKKAYSTRLKHTLMSGSQAAQVYYGPAVRNPLKGTTRPVV